MPNVPAKERQRRSALIKMVLGIAAELDKLGDGRDLLLVLMAVRLGNYQRRPMDVTGLAAATGLARTTVIRHIKALEELGRVKVVNAGRRTIPILTGDDRPMVKGFYTRLEQLVISASANLSKVDSSQMDTKRKEMLIARHPSHPRE
ncbi:MAG: transcriptional regulator [Mesorhizobium sp.]|uniref:helix-turn-helix domain-containing protein n=1 Tax=Mesorhizobium sp. TaxID=1871066 RepID=UPI000FE6D78C|nr:helix-turn-helix domain-containing protein [Mesorhizobium sp.]RWP18885.1 MAG: transcriptional regulator [Mesorhizobium sp.]